MERRQKYSTQVRELREMSSSPSFSSSSTAAAAAAAAAAAHSKPAGSHPPVRGGRIWNRQGQRFPPVEPGSVFLVAPWTKGVTAVAHAVSERNRVGAVVRSGPGKGLTAAVPFRVIVGADARCEYQSRRGGTKCGEVLRATNAYRCARHARVHRREEQLAQRAIGSDRRMMKRWLMTPSDKRKKKKRKKTNILDEKDEDEDDKDNFDTMLSRWDQSQGAGAAFVVAAGAGAGAAGAAHPAATPKRLHMVMMDDTAMDMRVRVQAGLGEHLID